MLDIYELLGREKMAFPLEYPTGRVVITGCAGSIGSSVLKKLHNNGTWVMGVDYSENEMSRLLEDFTFDYVLGDLNNDSTINQIINFAPDYIIHTAAHKHVKFVEKNPIEAVRSNILLTQKLVDACNAHGIKLVFISTDKAVYPTTTMGMTKRIAEKIVLNAGHQVIRMCNVIDSNGGVFEIFNNQIMEGKPLTITNVKMKRYFITKDECSDFIISSIGNGKKINVVDIGQETSIVGLAEKLLNHYGCTNEIKFIGEAGCEKLSEKLLYEDEL